MKLSHFIYVLNVAYYIMLVYVKPINISACGGYAATIRGVGKRIS